ncbi:MAG: MotA/TolQ/ExbB proton channel family protein [Acidobacteriota bacterium]|nr:MotA/TolQ/ExbB proton channel family protein [Blastocatellia bacterium]MDW8411919.1 MotA/TolQ/ExbB proton channel family protein [Acidobacteriota bacterium]
MDIYLAVQQNSLLDLILQASFIAKLVLLLLLGFSIVSWAIILMKLNAFRQAYLHTTAFLEAFRRSSKLADMHAVCRNYSRSPLTAIFLAGYEELDKQLRSFGSLKNTQALARAMQRASISEANKLEAGIGWLASTANASPFIGLFGTVVGIIIAFEGLSSNTQATIQAVAPGIAEALVATAAGIAAATPAAIAYNHFLNKIRILTSEMDEFVLEFLNLVEQ